MTKSPTCPACGGSHYTVLEFRRYRSGNKKSAVGPDLIEVTAPIPIPICLCGLVLGADSQTPKPLLADFKESYGRLREYRQGFNERLHNWAEQMVELSELGKRTQDIPRLEKLVQNASDIVRKVSK